MTVQELQIGDWVMRNGKPCRVDGIMPPHNIYIDRHYPLVVTMVESCEPIPLTEEILKANGFKKTRTYEREDGIMVEKLVYKTEDLVYWFEFKNVQGYDGYTWHGCDVNHVHQLQHALRLCGLTELADNFKIN